MKYIGKAIGTMSVWGGIVGLSWLFHSFNCFDGNGATGLVIAGILSTVAIWIND